MPKFKFPLFACLCALSLLFTACGGSDENEPAPEDLPSLDDVLGDLPEAEMDAAYDPAADVLRYTGEARLRNVKQLTFGGDNAEAYWSFDDEYLIFQSSWDQLTKQGCDQIFIMRANGEPMEAGQQYSLVSTDRGRTTCSYFMKDGRVLFASTHEHSDDCPPPPAKAEGRYVWPIHDSYDIWACETDRSNMTLLIHGPGYDAEATVSPDGKYIVFTSTRSGDLELWRYEIETGDLLQLTNTLGYDGGAFFSLDSKKIVWRASRPTGEAAKAYKALLKDGMVEPSDMNVFVADADGKNVVQVTDLPGANWAPYFHPDGERILFSSNHHSIETSGGREFDIFMINVDGTGLERITHSGTFDAFPMFSFDGSKLAFGSNRRADRASSRETNVMVAEWIENPTDADRNFVSNVAMPEASEHGHGGHGHGEGEEDGEGHGHSH